jgi:hypothetical protein
VTRWVSVSVSPVASVTVQVTVWTPTPKPPAGASWVIVSGAAPPEADALPIATAVSAPVASALRSEGALTVSASGPSVPAEPSIRVELPP